MSRHVGRDHGVMHHGLSVLRRTRVVLGRGTAYVSMENRLVIRERAARGGEACQGQAAGG